jgi:tRNA threonylcarbamoyladenosine biosynthesis protein TsaE
MEIIWQIQTNTPEATEEIGKKLANMILEDPNAPRFVALEGDLGVGKTVFVRGFVSVLVPGSAVRSPTFALVNEYRKKDTKLPVYHFDVYRINDEDDLYSTGFYDYLEADAVCLVEWSENIRYAFPKEYLTVRIEKNDIASTDSRMITVMLEGGR